MVIRHLPEGVACLFTARVVNVLNAVEQLYQNSTYKHTTYGCAKVAVGCS